MSMAATGVTGEDAIRKSAEPSAVSMAVLGVEGALLCAVLFLVALAGGSGTAFAEGARRGAAIEKSELIAALLMTPLLFLPVLFAATVLTVAYVLPALLLAHWTARQLTGRTAWWWIPPACTLWVLPALAIPSWQLAGLALYALALPPTLTAHFTVVRAESGRPIQPCAAILTWGALLVVCVVVVGGVMVGG
ncbi:hypothetical protein ACWD4G_42515 [Streptomyces sp. NPDC002643]